MTAVRPDLAADHLPDAADYEIGRSRRFDLLPPLEVVVTGYSSTPWQTDETPFLTASMTHVRPGVIALSRDLIRRYNPDAPFRYGDRIRVEGVGEFVVEDTMNQRYEKRADIWFETTDEAVRWGKRTLAITLVGAGGFDRRGASNPSG